MTKNKILQGKEWKWLSLMFCLLFLFSAISPESIYAVPCAEHCVGKSQTTSWGFECPVIGGSIARKTTTHWDTCPGGGDYTCQWGHDANAVKKTVEWYVASPMCIYTWTDTTETKGRRACTNI